VLTDTLPAGTTFITATLPFTQSGQIITWNRAALTDGETWSVELVVGVPADTTGEAVENLAYGVRADGVTAVSGPPVSTPIQPLPAPQLHLLKEVSASSADPGDVLTYTLTVSQTGSRPSVAALSPQADVTNLVLTDTLPVGTTFITATLPFTQDGETIVWNRASLAAGDVWAVQLVVQIPLLTDQTAVFNEWYGVQGEGVTAVSGPPVATLINPSYRVYIPTISKPAGE